MRATTAIFVLAAALLAPVSPLAAQDEVRSDIEALKQGQEQIRQDLAELKKLIQAAPKAAPAPAPPAGPDIKGMEIDLGANPVIGDDDAPVTLIEFTDYQCPFCSRHFRDTSPQIKTDYIDTGKVRWVTMDLPLESIHKLAVKAAEATHCAEDQGKFWEMHDRLFEHQRALEPWSGHAEALGLDVAAFNECMESGKHTEAVRKDAAQAAKTGARGTPSFVLAATDPANPMTVKGITFIRGARAYQFFKNDIDKGLAEATAD